MMKSSLQLPTVLIFALFIVTINIFIVSFSTTGNTAEEFTDTLPSFDENALPGLYQTPDQKEDNTESGITEGGITESEHTDVDYSDEVVLPDNLPKDGEEWENWDGWEDIKQDPAVIQQRESKNSAPVKTVQKAPSDLESLPNLELPDLELPNLELPNLELPKLELPDLDSVEEDIRSQEIHQPDEDGNSLPELTPTTETSSNTGTTNLSVPFEQAFWSEVATEPSAEIEADSHDLRRRYSRTRVNSEQTAGTLVESRQVVSLIEELKSVQERFQQRRLSSDRNSPFEVMMSLHAFGETSELFVPSKNKAFHPGSWLLWNNPAGELSIMNTRPIYPDDPVSVWFDFRHSVRGDMELPVASNWLPFASIGYCEQEKAGDLLEALASARVMPMYGFQFGQKKFTLVDLIEYQKLCCHGGDMSSIIVSMAAYCLDQQWENQTGQKWSVPRIVDHELNRTVSVETSDFTNRLYGLTYAVRRRYTIPDGSWERPYQRADSYISRMWNTALAVQNPNGSWNGSYFRYQGVSSDSEADFAATANITRWLVLAARNNQLEDDRLILALQYLAGWLTDHENSYVPEEMSQDQVRAWAFALQAFGIYTKRWNVKK